MWENAIRDSSLLILAFSLKGASIYDVCKEGGGGQEMQEICTQTVKILQTRSKNPKIRWTSYVEAYLALIIEVFPLEMFPNYIFGWQIDYLEEKYLLLWKFKVKATNK